MKLLLFVAALFVAATTCVDASDVDMYCVTSWFPRACELESGGNCVPGYTVRYVTESACDPSQNTEETEEDSNMYCVVSWNPRACEMVGGGNCEEGHTERFDSQEECEQTAETEQEETEEEEPEDPNMYCVVSWNPRACEMVGGGNCEEGHTERFDSQEECEQTAETEQEETEEEEPENPNMYCVTSWEPRECEMVGGGNCAEGHTERFSTYEECMPNWHTEGRFCRIDWWPGNCELESLGNCLRYFYVRYDSMEQCNPSYDNQCYASTHGTEDDTCGNYSFYDSTYGPFYEGFVGLMSGVTYWFDIPMNPDEADMSFAVEKDGSSVFKLYGLVEAESCEDAQAMTYTFSDVDLSSWMLSEDCEYMQVDSLDDLTTPVRACHETCVVTAVPVKSNPERA